MLYVIIFSKGLVDMHEKYYFVSYQWRNKKTDWQTASVVLNKHPLVWLKERVDSVEQYRITFFSEIEEGHYKLMYGWL